MDDTHPKQHKNHPCPAFVAQYGIHMEALFPSSYAADPARFSFAPAPASSFLAENPFLHGAAADPSVSSAILYSASPCRSLHHPQPMLTRQPPNQPPKLLQKNNLSYYSSSLISRIFSIKATQHRLLIHQ